LEDIIMTRIGNGGAPRSVWVDHNQQEIAAPQELRVIAVNRFGGGRVAIWHDEHGRRVNDPSLPAPSLDMVGFTATPNGKGGWIYGGEAADGSRPRGG
jgi:hypothetical protein